MSASRQERKVVTALFCDLVGFTSQAEEMDPEDVASLLHPYHARVREELERFGGTVEKFIGDAVMALFGAPVSHEDDAERAVRAALAIRQFATEDGLELRIGIATGDALVTLDARPDSGETMATGDVVNTAARLQAAAAVNGILVSEKTYRATSDVIEFRESQPVEAKGKAAPVPVREVIGALSDVVEDRVHASPLVGRRRELDLLAAALDRACVEEQPQLVTLVGVPGIGKSRLVHELVASGRAAQVTWLKGRCLPYGDGITLRALSDIVKEQLGILDTDTEVTVGERLRAAVEEDWVRDHLRALVGLDVESVAGGDRREEAYAAWRSYLEHSAAERPLVLVFEDLHWADDVLLDFVDYLVDWASGAAMLVVCTTRPELLERRPTWGGGKTNASTVSLTPLSDEETARLVGGLLGRALLEADVQEALLARAGGNPLYAEQYTRLLAEQRDVVLPESVQGLVAARLDLLDLEQKSLLQDASVVGTSFWLGALEAIGGIDRPRAEVTLHGLERKGFVRRERDTAISGDPQYAFQHVVVREVAYGQLPRGLRSERHARAAAWIEAAGRRHDDIDLLAHHYREALELGRAAGVDTSSLEEPARRAFRDAGDRALEVSAYVVAAGLYELALDLWPDPDGDRAELLFGRARAVNAGIDETRFDLFDEARDALLAADRLEDAAEAESLGALALRTSGRGVDALDRVRAAVARLEDRPPSRAKTYVLANCARLLAVQAFELQEAIDKATVALGAARDLGLPDLEAHALNTIGVARIGLWDVDGVSELEESLRIGLEHCSPFEIFRIYNNLASCYENAGLVPKADATYQEALALAERVGAPDRVRFAMNVAGSDFACGRWQDAWDRMHALGDALSGNHWAEGVIAEILFARDDLDGAVAACDRALDAIRAEQWDPDAAFALQAFLGLRAVLAQAEGRGDKAAELTGEILAIEPDPARFYPMGVAWLTLLHLELGLDDRAASLQVDGPFPWYAVARSMSEGRLTEAADRLENLGDFTLAAETRLVALRKLAAGGHRAEVAELLPKVLAFYRSVGATRYVREAETLLPSVA